MTAKLPRDLAELLKRGADRGSLARVVGPYIVFGAAWILFSDRLFLPLAKAQRTMLLISTAKGWLFVLVTAILLFALVKRELVRRGKLEARLREELAEKEALLAEVHHRVKNNLQVMTSIMNLESDGIVGEEARLLNNRTRARLRSMSLVHDQLYSSPGLSRVSLPAYIRDLSESLPGIFDLSGPRISFELDELEIGPEEAIPLGLFLGEAVTNAFRHGVGPNGRCELSLRLRGLGAGRAELVVRDSGPGLPEGAKGLGLQLMAALTAQLRGELALENEGGAVVRLTFPAQEAIHG